MKTITTYRCPTCDHIAWSPSCDQDAYSCRYCGHIIFGPEINGETYIVIKESDL